MTFSVIEGGAELLAHIEALWSELRNYHAESWPEWRASLMKSSFDGRVKRLLSKCQGGLLVLLARSDNQDVAYCVCSVDASAIGEVDSIFVRPAVRRKGIGHAMMQRAIEW